MEIRDKIGVAMSLLQQAATEQDDAARGESFTRSARAFVRRIEADLDARLGARRVEDLRATLRLIHESYKR